MSVVRRSSRLISICSLSSANLISGNIDDARRLFDQNPTTSLDIFSWNSMINAHIKHNQMQSAHQLFAKMPVRNVVSWNIMLSGLNSVKDPHGLYRFFLDMNIDGQIPNEVTFSTVLSSFFNTPFHILIPQLHGPILQLGLNSSVFVGSALMRGYTDLGDQQGLCRVFDDIFVKDVTTWNALVLGYMDLGFTKEAQLAFQMMPEVNVISWTTLINGYIKNRKLHQARSIFDKMREKNVVSWTAMIKGYVQYGNYFDALELFLLMLKSGTPPNHFTFSSVLSACAGCSSLVMGNQIHSSILKSGIPPDVILSTSLVDMYAKCGDIEAAFCIFESMKKKNLVSWNSIIGGYARHGLANRALYEFERMTKKSGVKPDHITFVNVLSACGHGGLIEEGERHFYSMGVKYGVEAEMKHYACMVDIYGRAGQLEKAEKLIKGMPFEPDVVVWGALLAACGLHSCSEVGEFAAEGLANLEQDHPAVYSMLLKIHSEKGVWCCVADIRNMMKERQTKKQKAGSWIESPFGVS